MSQRDLAAVLFSVLGVFLAVSRIPELLIYASYVVLWDPATADPASPVPQRAVPMVSVIALVVAVLVGLLLVAFRDKLSDILFSSRSGHIAEADVQAVALSVLGAYFVVQGIQGMMRFEALHWGGVVQAGLGLGLFFGAKVIAGFWRSLRAAAAPTRYE